MNHTSMSRRQVTSALCAPSAHPASLSNVGRFRIPRSAQKSGRPIEWRLSVVRASYLKMLLGWAPDLEPSLARVWANGGPRALVLTQRAIGGARAALGKKEAAARWRRLHAFRRRGRRVRFEGSALGGLLPARRLNGIPPPPKLRKFTTAGCLPIRIRPSASA